MEKQGALSHSEWVIMECLWVRPHTLMELVSSDPAFVQAAEKISAFVQRECLCVHELW